MWAVKVSRVTELPRDGNLDQRVWFWGLYYRDRREVLIVVLNSWSKRFVGNLVR